MNRKITTQRWISPLLMAISFTVFSLLWFSQSYTQGANPIQIQTPLGWDSWMPKAAKNPKVPEFLVFKVKIASSHANSSATFTLSEVTDWKGECMNGGTQSNSDKDLKFAISSEQASINGVTWEAGNQSLTARWRGTPPKSLPVKVLVHDYGAYGKLTAKLYRMSTTHTITIPKDNNGNMIADGWKSDYIVDNNGVVSEKSKNYNKSADDETGPGANPHDGDNFSVFTEYRGFKCVTGYADSKYTTAHKRLSPSQKEVLVFVAGSKLAPYGIGDASNLENDTEKKIVAYQVATHSGSSEYWVNYKGIDVPGHRNQRVVRVLENSFDDDEDVYGYTFPSPNHVDYSVYYPHRVDEIVIYMLEINDDFTSQSDRDKIIKNTIGHEIGHAINLDHCDGFHNGCIMQVVPPAIEISSSYDSNHDVKLNGYKIR